MIRRSLWGFSPGPRGLTKDGRLRSNDKIHDWNAILRLFEGSDALDDYKDRTLDSLRYPGA
jgi:hypothetical protein